MKTLKRFLPTILGLLVIASVATYSFMAQWGTQGAYYSMGSGGWQLNCPPSSCSITGTVANFPGLSAKSQLTANSAGSSTAGLINTGISFPIAANEVGTLNCTIYFTNDNGGGLTLAVNGPGTPTEVTISAEIESAATTGNLYVSQGTSWATAVGAATSSVTGAQYAQFSGGIENGTTAGTLAVQFSDVNTTGTTTVLRDSWCSFP